jgi:hypothetical protein
MSFGKRIDGMKTAVLMNRTQAVELFRRMGLRQAAGYDAERFNRRALEIMEGLEREDSPYYKNAKRLNEELLTRLNSLMEAMREGAEIELEEEVEAKTKEAPGATAKAKTKAKAKAKVQKNGKAKNLTRREDGSKEPWSATFGENSNSGKLDRAVTKKPQTAEQIADRSGCEILRTKAHLSFWVKRGRYARNDKGQYIKIHD